jgi:uncharacterized protein YjiS (DUF1127 family)
VPRDTTGAPPMDASRDRLVRWWRRRRQHASESRLAMQLSDRDLHDMGLTRGDLQRELHNGRRMRAMIP